MPLPDVSLNRRFSLPRDVDEELVLRALRVLGVIGKCDYSTYSVSVRSKQDYEFSFASLDEWKTFVGDRWTDISRARLYANCRDKSVSVTYDVVDGEARLSISAPTEEALDAVAEEAENILKLLRVPDGARRGLQGLRRKYFINEEVTSDWIKSLVEAIRLDVGPRPYVSARLRWTKPAAKEQVFEDLSAWQEELAANWPHVSSVYVWISSSGKRFLFDCDIGRELIDLESYCLSSEEALIRLSSVVSKFDLEEVPVTLFKYRRFAKSFKILHWKGNASFARAVELAIGEGFARKGKGSTRKPVLVESFTTTGRGSEDLEAIDSIDAFVARFGDAGASIDRAKLYVQGPRGRDLGILLDRAKEELWIGSSFGRKEFNAVVEYFENAIDLKLMKEETEPKEAAAKKSPGEGMLAKLVLAVVGLFLSVEVIKESIPRYSVEITFPRAQSDGRATAPAGNLTLHWIVHERRWWDTTDLVGPPEGMLTVLDSRGAEMPPGTEPIGKGERNFVPGHYELVLHFPALGKSTRLPLLVSASP